MSKHAKTISHGFKDARTSGTHTGGRGDSQTYCRIGALGKLTEGDKLAGEGKDSLPHTVPRKQKMTRTPLI